MMKSHILLCAMVLIVVLLCGTLPAQFASFVYQGQIKDNGNPADGSYDLRFTLHDEASGGIQVGTVFYADDKAVSRGLFSVELGFGPDAFIGSARWIEIAVRSGAADNADRNGYTVLSPRQKITPSPYAMFSLMTGAHIHDGSEIFTGIVTAARIDSALARDLEVDDKIFTHAQNPSTHHNWPLTDVDIPDELTLSGGSSINGGAIDSGTISDTRIPATITRDDEVPVIVWTNDGPGSGLDADILDGRDSTFFAVASHNHDADYAPILHQHAATDITSGQFSDAQVADNLTLSSSASINGLAIKSGLVGEAHIDPTMARDNEVVPIVVANGGAGSNINADYLDGQSSADFASATHTHPTNQLLKSFTIASGYIIDAGNIVGILNGQVQNQLQGIYNSAESRFNAGITSRCKIIALESDKIVVVYSDVSNSSYGTAIVGTIIGSAISWGSESVFNSAITEYISAVTISDAIFVVAYRDGGNSNKGTLRRGTVSGNVITWGTETVFNSGDTLDTALEKISGVNIVVGYNDAGNSNYGTVRMANPSGTGFALFGELVFNSAQTDGISITALDSRQFVIAYSDGGNSSFGTLIVGNTNLADVDWGPEYVFNADDTHNIDVETVTESAILTAYPDGAGSVGMCKYIKVSGSTFTEYYEDTFHAAKTSCSDLVMLSDSSFVVVYSDMDSPYHGQCARGRIFQDNTLDFETEKTFNSAGTFFNSAVSLGPYTFATAFDDYGDSDYGKVVLSSVPVLLGVAEDGGVAGKSIPVLLQGTSGRFANLLPGQMYYIEPNSYQVTPNRTNDRVGLAISAKELLLDIRR